MRQAIDLRLGLALVLLFSAACTSENKSPTISPTTGSVQTQPVVGATSILASTVIPSTETPAPNAANASSSTQTVNLFTESGGAYNINLTPADFVDVVDNPYFPLPPGAKWVYEIREGGKPTQTDTLEVLKDKRDVNGVQATVVRDTVSAGKKIVEDTFDWFAQDKYGNVWYVGESVDNYVGGVLVGHAGCSPRIRFQPLSHQRRDQHSFG